MAPMTWMSSAVADFDTWFAAVVNHGYDQGAVIDDSLAAEKKWKKLYRAGLTVEQAYAKAETGED